MLRLTSFVAGCAVVDAQSLHPKGPGSTQSSQDHSRVSRTHDGKFFAFSSSVHDDIGPVLIHSDSKDLAGSYWTMVEDGTKGSNFGAWVNDMWPGWMGAFWAPDVLQLGDEFLLYYSAHRDVRTYQKEACIGFARSKTPLEPSSWVDYGGPLVCSFDSGDRNDFHAIDPSVLLTPRGELWLSFAGDGDNGGVYALQLDSRTGGLRSGTSYNPLKPRPGYQNDVVHLANAPDQLGIEASSLDYLDGWYYLYWNRGDCCAGCSSTYNIRVARSRNVTGPYVDRSGAAVVGKTAVEGEMFYDYQGGPTGKWIGPGHFGRYMSDNDFGNVFSVHYYNADADDCAPAIEVRRLLIDGDGWVYQVDGETAV